MEQHSRKPCLEESNNNNNNYGDRLSSLPDPIIAEILSLLPTKSAISTSILSPRWRNLWTQISRLSLSFNSSSFSAQLSLNDISIILNHILRKITSPYIHIFDLKLNSCHIENQRFLEPWVRQICTLNPKEIKLEVYRWGGLSFLISIPSCVFECPSLLSLHFAGYPKLDYEFPENGSLFNTPNLKKLHINILDSHCPHMSLLFKSCPLLEDVYVGADFEEDGNSLDIRGHNLRRLELYLDGGCKGTVYTINAPELEDIYIQSIPVSSFRFVNSLDGLLKANVDVGCYCPESYDYLDEAMELLCLVSGVRSLRLDGTMFHALCDLEECQKDDGLPMFRNLTGLDILYWNTWLPFLRRCPNLESAFLVMANNDHVFFDEEDTEYSLGVPGCFSTTLKKINIVEFEGTDYEWVFLKYVLSNASVLEQLIVSLCSDSNNNCGLARELELCHALFSYPRSSSSCVIEFRGAFLTASSKSFKNEVLDHCQVNFRGRRF